MTCKTCRYAWVNTYGRHSGFADVGYYSTLHCRRYPPTRGHEHGNATASKAAAWVVVEADWWCGEWQAWQPAEEHPENSEKTATQVRQAPFEAC